MAGLKLKLRPEEQILINGAIIQNGSRQVELTVKTPNTRILRLRDAIHPDDATTPVKRVCYIAQLAVAGEVSDTEAYNDFSIGIQALQKVFFDEVSVMLMKKALDDAKDFDFYKAMQAMRKLIPYEDALFAKLNTLENIMPNESQNANNVISSLASLSNQLNTSSGSIYRN
jgi:flagellar protein FlbT